MTQNISSTKSPFDAFLNKIPQEQQNFTSSSMVKIISFWFSNLWC